MSGMMEKFRLLPVKHQLLAVYGGGGIFAGSIMVILTAVGVFVLRNTVVDESRSALESQVRTNAQLIAQESAAALEELLMVGVKAFALPVSYGIHDTYWAAAGMRGGDGTNNYGSAGTWTDKMSVKPWGSSLTNFPFPDNGDAGCTNSFLRKTTTVSGATAQCGTGAAAGWSTTTGTCVGASCCCKDTRFGADVQISTRASSVVVKNLPVSSGLEGTTACLTSDTYATCAGVNGIVSPKIDTARRAAMTDGFLPIAWDYKHNPGWIQAFQGFEDTTSRQYPGAAAENCNIPLAANLGPADNLAPHSGTPQSWLPAFCSVQTPVAWSGGSGPTSLNPETGTLISTKAAGQTDYSAGTRTYDPTVRGWYTAMKANLGRTSLDWQASGKFKYGVNLGSVYADSGGRGFVMSVGTQISDYTGNIIGNAIADCYVPSIQKIISSIKVRASGEAHLFHRSSKELAATQQKNWPTLYTWDFATNKYTIPPLVPKIDEVNIGTTTTKLQSSKMTATCSWTGSKCAGASGISCRALCTVTNSGSDGAGTCESKADGTCSAQGSGTVCSAACSASGVYQAASHEVLYQQALPTSEVPGGAFTAVIVTPLSEIYAAIDSHEDTIKEEAVVTFVIALAIVVGLTILLFIAAYILSAQLSRPLRKVSRKAELMTSNIGGALFEGEEDVEDVGADNGVGEVDDLCQEFHELFTELHDKRSDKLAGHMSSGRAPVNPIAEVGEIHRILGECDLQKGAGADPPEGLMAVLKKVGGDDAQEGKGNTEPVQGGRELQTRVTPFNKIQSKLIMWLIIPLIVMMVVVITVTSVMMATEGEDWVKPVKQVMIDEEKQALKIRSFEGAQMIKGMFTSYTNSLLLVKGYLDGLRDGDIVPRTGVAATDAYRPHYIGVRNHADSLCSNSAIAGCTTAPSTVTSMRKGGGPPNVRLQDSTFFRPLASQLQSGHTQPSDAYMLKLLDTLSHLENAARAAYFSNDLALVYFGSATSEVFWAYPWYDQTGYLTKQIDCYKDTYCANGASTCFGTQNTLTTVYTPVCRKWYAKARLKSPCNSPQTSHPHTQSDATGYLGGGTCVVYDTVDADGATGKPYIALAVPFDGTTTSEASFQFEAGVVTVDIDLGALKEAINSINVYSNGYAYLMDADGTVVVHKKSSAIGCPNANNAASTDACVSECVTVADAEAGSNTGIKRTFSGTDCLSSELLILKNLAVTASAGDSADDAVVRTWDKGGSQWLYAASRVEGLPYVVVLTVPMSDVESKANAVIDDVNAEVYRHIGLTVGITTVIAAALVYFSFRFVRVFVEPIITVTGIIQQWRLGSRKGRDGQDGMLEGGGDGGGYVEQIGIAEARNTSSQELLKIFRSMGRLLVALRFDNLQYELAMGSGDDINPNDPQAQAKVIAYQQKVRMDNYQEARYIVKDFQNERGIGVVDNNMAKLVHQKNEENNPEILNILDYGSVYADHGKAKAYDNQLCEGSIHNLEMARLDEATGNAKAVGEVQEVGGDPGPLSAVALLEEALRMATEAEGGQGDQFRIDLVTRNLLEVKGAEAMVAEIDTVEYTGKMQIEIVFQALVGKDGPAKVAAERWVKGQPGQQHKTLWETAYEKVSQADQDEETDVRSLGLLVVIMAEVYKDMHWAHCALKFPTIHHDVLTHAIGLFKKDGAFAKVDLEWGEPCWVVARDGAGHPYFTKNGMESTWCLNEHMNPYIKIQGMDNELGMWVEFRDDKGPYYVNIKTKECTRDHRDTGTPWIEVEQHQQSEGQRRYQSMFWMDLVMDQPGAGWIPSTPQQFGAGYQPKPPKFYPNPPESKDKPAATGTHFIFALDCSGSMIGKGWRLLTEAYAKFVTDRKISPDKGRDDMISIVTFSGEATVILRMRPLAQVSPQLEGKPGGGTKFKPPMEEVTTLMAATPWGQQGKYLALSLHFITDGVNADGDCSDYFVRLGSDYADRHLAVKMMTFEGIVPQAELEAEVPGTTYNVLQMLQEYSRKMVEAAKQKGGQAGAEAVAVNSDDIAAQFQSLAAKKGGFIQEVL